MGAKILLIEDEPDYAELVHAHLQAERFQVLVARNGIEGLNKARRHLPDLILIDILLGDLDGFTLCEIFKSQPSTAQTPLIILTAFSGELPRLVGFNAGAWEWVSKLEMRSKLLPTIREALQIAADQRAGIRHERAP